MDNIQNHLNKLRKANLLCNFLATAAVLCYLVALVAPAISDGGYSDGNMAVVESSPMPGLVCLIGLLVTCWFSVSDSMYLVSNLVFMPFLFRRDSSLALFRWLAMLACTVAPIHATARFSERAHFGLYFWLFAFVFSAVSHWFRFFYFSALNKLEGDRPNSA